MHTHWHSSAFAAFYCRSAMPAAGMHMTLWVTFPLTLPAPSARSMARQNSWRAAYACAWRLASRGIACCCLPAPPPTWAGRCTALYCFWVWVARAGAHAAARGAHTHTPARTHCLHLSHHLTCTPACTCCLSLCLFSSALLLGWLVRISWKKTEGPVFLDYGGGPRTLSLHYRTAHPAPPRSPLHLAFARRALLPALHTPPHLPALAPACLSSLYPHYTCAHSTHTAHLPHAAADGGPAAYLPLPSPPLSGWLLRSPPAILPELLACGVCRIADSLCRLLTLLSR